MQLDHRIVMLDDIKVKPAATITTKLEKLAQSFIDLGGNFVTPPVLIEDTIENYSVISGIEQVQAAFYATELEPEIETTNAFFISKEDEQLVKEQLILLTKNSPKTRPRQKTPLEKINDKLFAITNNPNLSAKKYTKKAIYDLGLARNGGYYVIESGQALNSTSIWIGRTLPQVLANLQGTGEMSSEIIRDIKRNHQNDDQNNNSLIPFTGTTLVPGTPIATIVQAKQNLQIVGSSLPYDFAYMLILMMIMLILMMRRLFDSENKNNDIEGEFHHESNTEEQQPVCLAKAQRLLLGNVSAKGFVEKIEIEFYPEGVYCSIPDHDGDYTEYTNPTRYEDIDVGRKVFFPPTKSDGIEGFATITAVSPDKSEFAVDGYGDEEWYMRNEVLIPHYGNANQVDWVDEQRPILGVSSQLALRGDHNLALEIWYDRFADDDSIFDVAHRHIVARQNVVANTTLTLGRNSTLGASEFAAALNVSNFDHCIDVYMRKLGLITEIEQDKMNARQLKQQSVFARGHDFEDYIGKLYESRTGHQLTDPQKEFIHPNYGWMRCHPDWMLDGCPVDAKSVNLNRLKFEKDTLTGKLVWGADGSDEVSSDCIIQAHGQMELTRANMAIMIVAFVDDEIYEGTKDKELSTVDFRIYYIHRNQAIIDDMMPKIVAFWEQNVIAQIPPPFDFHRKGVLKKQVRALNDQVDEESIIVNADHIVCRTPSENESQTITTMTDLQREIAESKAAVDFANNALKEAKMQLESKLAMMEAQMGNFQEMNIPGVGTYTRTKKIRKAHTRKIVESCAINCTFKGE